MHRFAISDITGLLLAGGQGARMGGADKGFVAYEGRPLVEWALERLRPQVGAVMISANRNIERYAAYGCPVVSDDARDSYAGPLAGLIAGLRACPTALLAVVPCDTPHFPVDLVATLAAALADPAVPLAFAATDVREHPVFMLCRRAARAQLADYFAKGGRAIRDWQRGIGAVQVLFPDETAFANINTPDDLDAAR